MHCHCYILDSSIDTTLRNVNVLYHWQLLTVRLFLVLSVVYLFFSLTTLLLFAQLALFCYAATFVYYYSDCHRLLWHLIVYYFVISISNWGCWFWLNTRGIIEISESVNGLDYLEMCQVGRSDGSGFGLGDNSANKGIRIQVAQKIKCM